MAKRKRADEHTDGETFSLLDGNVDILEGLVMHRNAIDEQFEQAQYEMLHRKHATANT